jgi:hypothetical protein
MHWPSDVATHVQCESDLGEEEYKGSVMVLLSLCGIVKGTKGGSWMMEATESVPTKGVWHLQEHRRLRVWHWHLSQHHDPPTRLEQLPESRGCEPVTAARHVTGAVQQLLHPCLPALPPDCIRSSASLTCTRAWCRCCSSACTCQCGEVCSHCAAKHEPTKGLMETWNGQILIASQEAWTTSTGCVCNSTAF